MVILLLSVAYLVIGLPFVAWLGRRLAQQDPATWDAMAPPAAALEVEAG